MGDNKSCLESTTVSDRFYIENLILLVIKRCLVISCNITNKSVNLL